MAINALEYIKQPSKDTFFLLAGPCVVESQALADETAGQLKEICSKLNIPFIYKSSYRKANRSKASSFTGLGDEMALEILKKVKAEFHLPIVTDIHAPDEAAFAAQVADVLQIPAFLCRQTDILEAAAATGKVVNIKKGQFLSPESMQFAAEKVTMHGNPNVMLTERGTFFGYQDLVVDFRGIATMKTFGHPVVMDCTHSLQQPNQAGGVSGGLPAYIENMALAALAVGADGLFIETHPEPSKALSDGANMLPISKIEALLERALKLKQALR